MEEETTNKLEHFHAMLSHRRFSDVAWGIERKHFCYSSTRSSTQTAVA